MDSLKEKFIDLRAEGYSFDIISKKLKKAKGTLIAWNKELEEEISNRRALNLEALYAKYFLLKEARIKMFGEVLIKIQLELEERNFANISTEKLLELLPKYHLFLKDEFVEPKFLTEQEIQEQKQEKQGLESLITILSNQAKN